MKYLALFALIIITACAKKPKPEATVFESASKAVFVPDEAKPAQDEVMIDFEIEDSFPKDPIRFDLNSDAIVNPYFVDRLGAWMKDHGQRIVLTGHACPIGEDDYNYNLAERRAVAVKAHLVTKFDLPGERIRIESKGESVPVTLDPSLFPLNRRVEVAMENQ